MDHSMNVKVTNHCKKRYWPNHLKIVNGILRKIPEKYLEGLGEIEFFDDSNNPIAQYIENDPQKKYSIIKVYMYDITKFRFYSALYLNMLILPHITDHIVNHLQPSSEDRDILLVKPHRYNPKWMYLGLFFPELIPVKMIGFIYKRSTKLQEVAFNKAMQYYKKK